VIQWINDSIDCFSDEGNGLESLNRVAWLGCANRRTHHTHHTLQKKRAGFIVVSIASIGSGHCFNP
jgi:hypothetical protein